MNERASGGRPGGFFTRRGRLRFVRVVLVLCGLCLRGIAGGGVPVEAEAGDETEGRRVAAAVERAGVRIEKALGVGLREGVRVKVVRGREAFEKACGQAMPGWAMAAALRGENAIVVDASRAAPATANDLYLTLVHETVHLALFGLEADRSDKLPIWFHEGVAQWLSGQGIFRASQTGFFAAAAAGRLIPFEELRQRFPREPWRAEVAYVESELFIGYLVRTRSKRILAEILKRYREGRSLDAAFAAAAGAPIRQVEKEWAARYRKTRTWLRWFWDLTGLTAVMALLTVAVWLIVRWRARRQRQAWERDEAWAAVLDEEEPPNEEPVDTDDEDWY